MKDPPHTTIPPTRAKKITQTGMDSLTNPSMRTTRWYSAASSLTPVSPVITTTTPVSVIPQRWPMPMIMPWRTKNEKPYRARAQHDSRTLIHRRTSLTDMPNGYTIKPNGLQGKECAMSTTKDLLNVLGGASIIRKRIESTRDMTEAIRQGIPYLSLIALATAAHLELNKMSTVLMIPMRTMARRRESKRLTAEESDRLVRLARIFTHAINVFGDRDKAAKWLQRRIERSVIRRRSTLSTQILESKKLKRSLVALNMASTVNEGLATHSKRSRVARRGGSSTLWWTLELPQYSDSVYVRDTLACRTRIPRPSRHRPHPKQCG